MYGATEVLTFDCYGTLIDWESGLWTALEPVFAAHRIEIGAEQALELFAQLEAQAESGEYQSYRTVLKTVLTGFGARLGFEPTNREFDEFAESVGRWPPFTDTGDALQALKTQYRLAIVSNVDDDLLARSIEQMKVPFDWVITAEQVKSYKPALAHFSTALATIGLPPERVLHVAQSLYHDIGPAKALGLRTVWVNRRQDRAGSGATPPAQAEPDLEVANLETLARWLGGHDVTLWRPAGARA
jgi:2-haloacid dehalogenase